MQSILEGIDIDNGSEALEKLQKAMYDIIIKSLCLSTPHVTHLIRSCHPDGEGNQLLFQILGFDIMIDSNLRPYLIEINQMPSFATDSPLDARVKRGLLADCFKTLCMTNEKKMACKRDIEEKIKNRLLKP